MTGKEFKEISLNSEMPTNMLAAVHEIEAGKHGINGPISLVMEMVRDGALKEWDGNG